MGQHRWEEFADIAEVWDDLCLQLSVRFIVISVRIIDEGCFEKPIAVAKKIWGHWRKCSHCIK